MRIQLCAVEVPFDILTDYIYVTKEEIFFSEKT